MKKILVFGCTLALLCSLTACGAANTTVDYYGSYLEENVPGKVLIGGEAEGFAEGKALPFSEDSPNPEATAA